MQLKKNVVCCSPQLIPKTFGKTSFNGVVYDQIQVYNCLQNIPNINSYMIYGKNLELQAPERIDILITMPALPIWIQDRTGYQEILKKAKFVIWIIDGAESEKTKSSGTMDPRFIDINKNRLFLYNYFYESCKHTPAEPFLWNYFLDFQPRFPRIEPDIQGVLYYGKFRNDRINSYERFFHEDYPLHISSHSGECAKFKRYYPNANLYNKLTFTNIRRFESTLYITDDDLQKLPYFAGRYMESVSMGVLPFIDVKCRNNFAEISQFIIEDQIVQDSKDLKEKLKSSEKIRKDFLKKVDKVNFQKIAQDRFMKLIKRFL